MINISGQVWYSTPIQPFKGYIRFNLFFAGYITYIGSEMFTYQVLQMFGHKFNKYE